ncbi:MAG: Gfo/Idh/MocA family oxidoreductase [Hyphomicrobiales bacterium]|nr:Gfo/Idh/MocA family oxidoreductase [Hyphomicrobiales bacterium]
MSYSLLRDFGRRIRWGLVGGGLDSIIGETHRLCARLDNRLDLVAGAMSIDPEVARETAEVCLLDPDRSYADFRDMAEREAEREDGVEVVTIATPPHLHREIAELFLDRGIDVICEKPMTKTLTEAKQLSDRVSHGDRLFALTHCYTGYPMVREARALVARGAIGDVRQIECDFPSGPFMQEDPDRGSRHWRFKPEMMSKESILGEVGSHAVNMAQFVAQKKPAALSASMTILTEGRETYDDVQIAMRYPDGALGRMWLSFVAAGNEHGLSFRIHGTEGSLAWRQEQPEALWLRHTGKPAERLTRGHPDRMTPEGFHACRIREGHPEGYILAFANLYRDFADAFMARQLGTGVEGSLGHFPTVEDGVDTMRFYEAAARSNQQCGAWVDV